MPQARAAAHRARASTSSEWTTTSSHLPEDKIRELVRKAGVPARELLRTKEPRAKELATREADDDEVIAAMAADPVLMERPVIERGDRAVLGRPVERVLELLS